ncbi:hypothetical protein PVAG01_04157 [Phlyctema vagabunda]|uniref:F-box domain-containing protein n=1 Tax=Phlyctema vagabunda TaxID=108571 RepID=A0ABR4PNG1_9HELO
MALRHSSSSTRSTQGLKEDATDMEMMKTSAFNRLPDEIIEQILEYTTPNSFASLIVLNRKWRAVSQQAYLYAHHLARCPSYSAAHRSIPPPADEESLPSLRRQFAQEIKRNLFEAYLRPREMIINLVSTSISSSSAPGGEAFHFSISSKGHYILAYSSSRIHVIDVSGSEVVVKRELKILRKPASTTITDDGSLLAVLSMDLQIDIYDLTGERPQHIRAIELDNSPRTITLSPTGSVLAAAYDSGVEVSSLDPAATTARRSVKCYAVDSLCFSRDGTQLLGTTLQSRNPSTVVLTAPYYTPGSSLSEDSVSALWTTSILFPNGSRDCSHAVLLPSLQDDEATWTFTYDRVFETFRAVRIDDLRNGTTYFTGPTAEYGSSTHLLPSTLPSASESGELVAAGFQGSVWLYGVPEDLDAPPSISNGANSNVETEAGTPLSPTTRRNSAPSLRSMNRQSSTAGRPPQWQLLGDRLRNTFIEGRKVTTLDGVSDVAWVSSRSSSHCERLVTVAPGIGEKSSISDDDGMMPTDGGRITILDFGYSSSNGPKSLVTIEVGQAEPEILEEEHKDLETAVAIVRRRTVAQRRGQRSGDDSRTATTVDRPTPAVPSIPAREDPHDSFSALVSTRTAEQVNVADPGDDQSAEEDEDVFDAPYSQTSPRSGTTLRRAATAAAINRRLYPRAVAQDHIEFRRADGREEHPHESDADNWVPPPPPYSKDPIPTLPEHIQRSILAERASKQQPSNASRIPIFDPSDLTGLRSLHRSRSTFSPVAQSRVPLQRTLSESTTRTSTNTSIDEDFPRPVTSPGLTTFENLYDATPPGTPKPTTRETPADDQISGGSVTFATSSATAAPISQQISSPIPTPAVEESSESLETLLPDWERPLDLDLSLISATPEPATSTLSRERMDKALPAPPNDDHRLLFPPPTTEGLLSEDGMPKIQPSPPPPRHSQTVPIPRPAVDEGEEPTPLQRRSVSAPIVASQMQNGSLSPDISSMELPSADQMARLNSRKGRPSPKALNDPSRRRSGSNPRNMPQLDPQTLLQRRSLSNGGHSTRPRAAAGAHNGSDSDSQLTPSKSPSHGLQPPSASPSPSRRVSPRNSHPRFAPPPPDMRPPMARLETIRSVSSMGEPSPFYMAPKQMTLGRTPSRAERSAAKNIKDAKKKGWRASMRKGRSKEVASAPVPVTRSYGSSESESGQKNDKTGGKCVVM